MQQPTYLIMTVPRSLTTCACVEVFGILQGCAFEVYEHIENTRLRRFTDNVVPKSRVRRKYECYGFRWIGD